MSVPHWDRTHEAWHRFGMAVGTCRAPTPHPKLPDSLSTAQSCSQEREEPDLEMCSSGAAVTVEMGAADSTSILPCAGICAGCPLPRGQSLCWGPVPCGLLDRAARSCQPFPRGAVVLPLTDTAGSVGEESGEGPECRVGADTAQKGCRGDS